MPHAEFTAVTTATPDAVFKHLAVAEAWSRWFIPAPRASRARTGDAEPNGVGAIRKIFPVREQVVAYDEGKHYAYTLLPPGPVKNYRADVRLSPNGTGAEIHWAGRGEPLIPGTAPVVKVFLGVLTKLLTKRMVRHAARCTPECPGYTPR